MIRLRSAIPSWLALPAAVVLALGLCALFLLLAGKNPLQAGQALVLGALGSPNRVAESLAKTIPLIMTGLGVTLAFRAGFFNIGAEGQFLLGALLGAGIGTKMGAPIPLVLFGGAAGGAVWALLAGLMKTRRGAPEIITTIMLNYIALRLVEFSLQVPDTEGSPHGWLIEKALSQPQSDLMPAGAQLPALLRGTTLHFGIFLALACAGLVWWLLFRAERGFLMRAVGANPLAARANGIGIESNTLLAVGLAGALCGLGGAMEVAGATKQLGTSGPGYGYTAIAVALLARLNPLAVVPAALLFGMLSAGGGAMERNTGVPAVTVSIITGLLVFLLAALPRLNQKSI